MTPGHHWSNKHFGCLQQGSGYRTEVGLGLAGGSQGVKAGGPVNQGLDRWLWNDRTELAQVGMTSGKAQRSCFDGM